MSEILHDEVKEYYGQTLSTSGDLQTTACCTATKPPKHIRDTISLIHNEVLEKYYGCGLTIPDAIENLTVLDLGSGSGRDCYIASKLVGEKGRVIGVDMTEAQLKVAQKHITYHQEQFGYHEPNVSFINGNIERLDQLGLSEESLDLIISNCVINLAQNKDKVLKDAFSLLKAGGEMYFSDVYCSRRIPEDLQNNKVLWGECLSGALYWNDFLRLAKKNGFTDPRVVESKPIDIENEELEKLLEGYDFYSVTYRLFKIEGLESDCEDFGQAVRYKGGIEHTGKIFKLDDHHIFEQGKLMPVCGNTFLMLQKTRYNKYFDFYGDWNVHYGIFEGCGTDIPYQSSSADENGNACC